jgi:GAF domain-containing protein
VAILAGFVGVYLARRLATPLLDLTETATRITEGSTELQAAIAGPAEVATLAGAFNSMTAQLRELIGSLEQRVADRTQRLEIVATLGEHLSAILNFDQLLEELVNQVKEQFDYYHAHVYIIDERRQNLVMTAGAGEAGATMKVRGHHIPLEAPTSLVARAARTNEIVWIGNVREAEDWLPNPLLPDTYSEMAVPIILDEQVVGVLDVQQDRIAGLDEGDAGLLRSLANQVAVAIRNARLFAEVEASLATARSTQERYLQQGWAIVDNAAKSGLYHYHRPDAAPLEVDMTTRLEQEAARQSEPIIVTIEGEGAAEASPQSQTAVVAPIRLQNQTIGVIQLQETDPSQSSRYWSEQELALIRMVADQVAQAAENLRLFEETREQAGREQTIREITEKLRAAPSLDILLETAARELGQRLDVPHTVLELGIDAPAEHSEN